jgi:hypothetical protein
LDDQIIGSRGAYLARVIEVFEVKRPAFFARFRREIAHGHAIHFPALASKRVDLASDWHGLPIPGRYLNGLPDISHLFS